MAIAVLGIDLGKNSCSVAGLDETGRVVLRRRLTRDGVVRLAAGLPACVMAMEACCGAHHLGRVLREQGHEVRLMSPEYVQPYVKAQKNDERDAEAIAEAATRPTMRFVELKSEAQLDAQILHRARTRLVGQRTALINQLRAVLLERGIVVPKGRRQLQQYLIRLLDEEGDLSDELLVAGAMEGEMTFVSQALSRRSGIRADVAMDELLSGDDKRAMAVLRTAGVTRQVAASLLAGVGDLLGIPDPGKAIDAFDQFTDAEVEDALTWLTTDPTYQSGVNALGKPNGKRSV